MAIDGVRYLAPVDTNIIIFELASSQLEEEFMAYMAQSQIQLISMGSGKLRFVTHRDYTDEQHRYVLSCIQQFKFSQS